MITLHEFDPMFYSWEEIVAKVYEAVKTGSAIYPYSESHTQKVSDTQQA